MKTFKIKRSEWLKGEGSKNSCLLRKEDNKKCCFGFYALSCGLKEKQIINLSDPTEIENLPLEMDWVINQNCRTRPWRCCSRQVNRLICANDEENVISSEREEKVIVLFKEQNILVEFED